MHKSVKERSGRDLFMENDDINVSDGSEMHEVWKIAPTQGYCLGVEKGRWECARPRSISLSLRRQAKLSENSAGRWSSNSQREARSREGKGLSRPTNISRPRLPSPRHGSQRIAKYPSSFALLEESSGNGIAIGKSQCNGNPTRVSILPQQ